MVVPLIAMWYATPPISMSDNDTLNGLEPDFEHMPEYANAMRAFETLREFLEEDGWNPQRIEKKFIYRTYYYGKNGELRCYGQIQVDMQQFLFYTVATFRVPENMRSVVAEYITRANYGLRIGNFELDFSDGEVRYKSSIDFEGEVLSKKMIKVAIYPAVQTMDHYMPGLMKVLYGGLPPIEAIADVENNA